MTNVKTLLALVLVFAATGFAQGPTAADQAQTIADILTVIESENAYAAQKCGHFGKIEYLCRTEPGCVWSGIPERFVPPGMWPI